MKLLVIFIIAGLLLCSAIILDHNDNGGINMEGEKEYQGPVPEGYDEKHFRDTGETIKVGDNINGE